MSIDQPSFLEELPFAFGQGFLEDHAGHIITDPGVALIELIANSYDAGATEVKIRWPDQIPGSFEISDNGTGMNREEFNRRWKTLKYNRLLEQGSDVAFPPMTKAKKRTAFGHGGKGRHGAFCFADSYEIETSRDGQKVSAKVSRSRSGIEPFHCEITSVGDAKGHGTIVRTEATKNIIKLEEIVELVGSKFAVDPGFSVVINERAVTLLNLKSLTTEEVKVEGIGTVKIHQVESTQNERNTRFRGIVWWVNSRMVGDPSWHGLDDKGSILDGRSSYAKKYSFIVEADFLKPALKVDWTGFHDTKESVAAKDVVKDHVIKRLHEFLSSSRKERKQKVITEHRKAIGELPEISKKVVGKFIDEVQQNCPTISEIDLSRTVEILATLEVSRSGYDLLERLADCSPDDLDTWNRLMEEWTASNAETVLNELGKRIRLIQDLEKLVHSKTADELHDLQPLFAKGLWMFGHEFESADFTSNRGMATVVRELLGGTNDETSRKRPDIVMLPESSISIHAADSYSGDGEVNGLRSVIIVELKKGGFPLTMQEVRQAEDYALEIRNARLVQKTTKITAYVLGATLEGAEAGTRGEQITIVPMPYDLVLQQAHARTFKLQKKLQAVFPKQHVDQDIETVLSMPDQDEMEFSESVNQ